jgi:16S rRNA (adenine1518-N6/adenine1519-N6)-dimethyltransferase
VLFRSLGSTTRDTVIEIGAGRGALTEQLVARSARVVAIEVDRVLGAALRRRWAGDARVEVVERDVLDVEFGALAGGGPFLLAGNIPYNITTPILFHALERPRPARAVYLVQREVAERVVAAPGSEAYGALSANLQAVARAELLFRVAAGAFTPPPKVESAVLRVTPLEPPVIAPHEEGPFRTMVVGDFGFRRKQMTRVIRELWALGADAAAAVLAEAQVDPRVRPEVLGPADFARLLRARARRS